MISLIEVDGVGEKTISLLKKLGIYSVEDLLYYYPRRYDILKRSDMRYVQNKDKVMIDGIVESVPTIVNVSSKLKRVLFRIVTNSSIYQVSVFNQVYLCRELKVGTKVIVIGTYDKYRNMIVAKEVRGGQLGDKPEVEPIYGTVSGLNRKMISKIIQSAFRLNLNLIDYVPRYLKERYHFLEKIEAMFFIHHPSDVVSFKRAKQRLKYEEFFLYLLKIGYLKQCICKDNQAIQRTFDDTKLDKLIKELPFALTGDQKQAILEIKGDLLSNRRMNRLVQGDVGSGKTIVAFLAAYMNYLAGYQTALMVPTEILANQHYQNALDLFQNTDMEIVLLTSNVSSKEKKKIIQKIGDGRASFVIGTQSLIQESVRYFNLGLIITDEQHRFGVNQRNDLKNKGSYPDILSMSATPIPRTYALTIYGDMDVSNIRTKPAGRKEVITCCKNEDNIVDVLEMMKKELDHGHQVYVIAPSIHKDDSVELDNVVQLKEKMKLAFGKKFLIGAVHGKLDNTEKVHVMDDFEKGKVQILISTTVIEVGVNVPNASMIVIFQANLFGLSTLHQLRGRVGRGDIQSYCVLVSKERCERLEILENTNDGFLISEYDFKLRGEGDLFGVKQSGEAEFRLANIKKDFELLVRVKQDVDEFFEQYIQLDEYRYFYDYLKDFDRLD